MLQEGRNQGVTGLLDLPGQGAKFEGRVLAFTNAYASQLLDAAGRGDSFWTEKRPLSSTGVVTVTGEVRLDGWPLPTQFRGELGTLTLTQTTGVAITNEVRVESSSFKKPTTESGLWQFTHVCKLVSDPTLAGFSGTQPVSAEETFTDKELWAETFKKQDSLHLLSGARVRLLAWGVGDNDTDEIDKLNDVIAAMAAPFTTMKTRAATFTRLSVTAAFVDVEFGLTTSAEDQINPRTETSIDPQGLESHATSAALNAVPAAPTGDNFVLWQTTTNEINDENILSVAEYKKLTTKEAVEFPGSIPQTDPLHLEDEATITNVTTSGTPPSTPAAPLGQIVKIISEQLTDDNHWKHTWQYANNNSVQKVEFPGTDTEEDPSDLVDEDRATIVSTSSTPPATPTPTPNTLKLRRRVSQRIGGTPEKWKHTFEFARRTTQDDVEMENTNTKVDPFAIEAGGTITQVTASGTPPATPAAPTTGSVFVDSVTQQIHDSKWRHTFFYGPQTTSDMATFPHTWTMADPSDLNSEGEIAAIDSIPSVPAGYYSRGEVGHYLTNAGKLLHVVKFGRTSTAQDLVNENSGSEGTPFEGLKTHTATLLTTASSADVVAAAAFSTAVNFDFVKARTINDNKVLRIDGIRDNPRIIDFEMVASGKRWVAARLNDDGDVMVFVRTISQQADRWAYEIAETPYFGNLMEFFIRKRVTGSSIDMFWDLSNTTNDGDFLGLPIHTVTYGGIRGQHNYSNGGPAEIYYKLVYDTLGQFDVKGATPGWHATTVDLSAIDPGTWVLATDLAEGDTNFDSAVLDEANYDGLIS